MTIVCESIQGAKALSIKFAELMAKTNQLKTYSRNRLAVITEDGDTYRFIIRHPSHSVTHGLNRNEYMTDNVFEKWAMEKYMEDNNVTLQ